MYNIAPKPTRYNGVEFRSRLEARWAAFFDICGWKWDYEPIDLQGWSPDFLIRTPLCNVLVEVKPASMDQRRSDPSFGKAKAHWQKSQVLLLGLAPKEHSQALGVGNLMDPPLDAEYEWEELHEFFRRLGTDEIWREAGNIVQWHP